MNEISEVSVAQKSTVGQTTISVNEVIGYRDQITSLQQQLATQRVNSAVLEERIAELKKGEKVIIKDSWGKQLETRNLSDVVEDIRKNEETKLGKELVQLRLTNKELKLKVEELNGELDIAENQKDEAIEKAIERETKSLKEKIEKNSEKYESVVDDYKSKEESLKSDFNKKESKLLDQIKDLQLQLKDKSEAQQLEKQLNEYRNLIDELRKENERLSSGNIISRIANRFKSNDDYVDRVNKSLTNLLTSIPDAKAVAERIPDNFNKYATKKIVAERKVDRNNGEEAYYDSRYGWNTRNRYKTVTVVEFED